MFKVVQVLNGDQIRVEPSWTWIDNSGVEREGDVVVVFGYRTPEKGMAGYEFAKSKLEALLLNKDVELYNPRFFKNFGFEKIVCSVYLDDVDIANYFPEFIRYQPINGWAE